LSRKSIRLFQKKACLLAAFWTTAFRRTHSPRREKGEDCKDHTITCIDRAPHPPHHAFNNQAAFFSDWRCV
jgi:hypothetical protein